MANTQTETFNAALANASKTVKQDAANYYNKVTTQNSNSDAINLLSSMKDSLTKLNNESKNTSKLNTVDKLIKASNPVNKDYQTNTKTLVKPQVSKNVGIIKTEKTLNLTQKENKIKSPIEAPIESKTVVRGQPLNLDKTMLSLNKLPSILSKGLEKSISNIKITPQITQKTLLKPEQKIVGTVNKPSIEKTTIIKDTKPLVTPKIQTVIKESKPLVTPKIQTVIKESKPLVTPKIQTVIKESKPLVTPKIQTVIKESKPLVTPKVQSKIIPQKPIESRNIISTLKQLESVKNVRIENKPLKLNEIKPVQHTIIKDRTIREVTKQPKSALQLDNSSIASSTENKKLNVLSSFLTNNFADVLAMKIANAIKSTTKETDNSGFAASTIDPLQ